MALRWTAAGMLEAEQNFKRVPGHVDLAELAVAIEREVTRNITTLQAPIRSTSDPNAATLTTP